jgi:hypothetical protein
VFKFFQPIVDKLFLVCIYLSKKDGIDETKKKRKTKNKNFSKTLLLYMLPALSSANDDNGNHDNNNNNICKTYQYHNRVPLGLRNSHNNCWVNALFQVIAVDPVYSYLFQEFLPPEFKAWKELLREYKLQQNAGVTMFLQDTTVLRECVMKSISSSQEDSHEGMMKLFGCLPDGNAMVCEMHKLEGMVSISTTKTTVKKNCQMKKCKHQATHGFDANVWIPGQIIRYLEATNEFPKLNKQQELEQFSVVEYENGVAPRLVSQNNSSQIILPLESDGNHDDDDDEEKESNTTRNSLQFEDLLDRYSYTALKKEQQYSISAVNLEKRVEIHRIVAEKWELAVDPVSGHLPIMIPVMLKRTAVVFGGKTFRTKKLTQDVDVPFTVNFSHLFDRRAKSASRFAFTDFQYELYAFIQHLSSVSNVGHYVSYICTTPPGTMLPNQKWYCCNDLKITSVTQSEQVENAAKQAYFLFFRKRNIPESNALLSRKNHDSLSAEQKEKLNAMSTKLINTFAVSNNFNTNNISTTKPPTAASFSSSYFTMRKCGAFDVGRTYQKGEVIRYHDQLYCSLIQDNKQPVRKNPKYWVLVTEDQVNYSQHYSQQQQAVSKPSPIYFGGLTERITHWDHFSS